MKDNQPRACDSCGRFRLYSELKLFYVPDSEGIAEQIWYKCVQCLESKPSEGVSEETLMGGRG